MIIRAINQASSGGGSSGGLFSGTGLTRSITVKSNGSTEATEVRTGSKRKSGDLGETSEKRERKSKQSDKRVFVTKNGDSEIKTKATITLGDMGKYYFVYKSILFAQEKSKMVQSRRLRAQNRQSFLLLYMRVTRRRPSRQKIRKI